MRECVGAIAKAVLLLRRSVSNDYKTLDIAY